MKPAKCIHNHVAFYSCKDPETGEIYTVKVCLTCGRVLEFKLKEPRAARKA